jgi:threonine/homoserine/homoserine lactone efflux protein
MIEYTFLIGVALTLMAALLSPGPSFLYVARTAVAISRKNALAVALGLASGSAIFATIATFGLYIILEAVPWLYVSLKVAGGLYLIYIAYKIWNSAKKPLVENDSQTENKPTLINSFTTGLLVQITNPKTAIVFGSIFAAFLPSVIPEYAYFFLVAISFSLAAGWYSVVALLLSAEKPKQVYSSWKHIIDRVAGGIMGVLGIKLATNH